MIAGAMGPFLQVLRKKSKYSPSNAEYQVRWRTSPTTGCPTRWLRTAATILTCIHFSSQARKEFERDPSPPPETVWAHRDSPAIKFSPFNR
eukprot:SAG31_NODE_3387_length_4330_cov_3.992437_2_plen_91_part_00